MMKGIRISRRDVVSLFRQAAASLPEGFSASAVAIDSRKVVPGTLFVAIAGENHDAHRYLAEVKSAGAVAAVVSASKVHLAKKAEIPFIAVEDTVKALGALAALWRAKLSATVIGITGSSGKTTTKEMLLSVLSKAGETVATYANNNNHIGVPLTIFSANAGTKYLILEMGTNHFGEIDYTAAIGSPDLAYITMIGESHLEYLKDLDGVYTEKKALFAATAVNGGVVLVNSDDPRLSAATTEFPGTVTCGFASGATILGRAAGYNAHGMPRLAVRFRKKQYTFTVPLHGKHNLNNALAVAGMALLLGVSREQISRGFASCSQVKQRFAVTRAGGALLIDDTYNANPSSMRAALATVKEMRGRRRAVLVLGDMFELGAQSTLMHKGLAPMVAACRPGRVLLIGKAMKHLAARLKEHKIDAFWTTSRRKLAAALQEQPLNNAILLFKGSRGMRMEEFVAICQKHLEL